MKLLLYNNKSTSNTINKVLEDETEYNITFKDLTDITNPSIRLKTDDVPNFNYAYIPHLDRYYFINDVETFPNRMFTLHMEIDVLETYKEDILESVATVGRSKASNPYYDGGGYRSEVRNEHKIYESDTTVEFGENTILVTIGG